MQRAGPAGQLDQSAPGRSELERRSIIVPCVQANIAKVAEFSALEARGTDRKHSNHLKTSFFNLNTITSQMF